MDMQKGLIYLAGGCFWGVEYYLKKLKGVLRTEVGYMGGELQNPSYEDICTGNTGHAEAVLVEFDEKQLSTEDILHYFFRLHDPTTPNQQGNDIGSQYRSAIFTTSQEQGEVAEKLIKDLDASGKWQKKVVTQILPATNFYKAEDYHQDYLDKNPQGYNCHFLRD
tara:strand:+ start:4573 stop:5067 length:495 start_codon:yes stop_codon:yes gene_type:complete